MDPAQVKATLLTFAELLSMSVHFAGNSQINGVIEDMMKRRLSEVGKGVGLTQGHVRLGEHAFDIHPHFLRARGEGKTHVPVSITAHDSITT